MLTLEIDIEAPWPQAGAQASAKACDWEALANRAASAAAGVAPELANDRLLASLLFTADDNVRALNRDWRARDEATNVLSFPMLDRADLLGLTGDGPPELLGDIALAYETCAREAADKGLAVAVHATHLIIHGLLHLAGYDHVASIAQAEAMEALEIKALASLGLGNPYTAPGWADGATG
ncbi:MAG: rRNA maturation RNase YbeY [Pseudomonadota bacterium]|nr:rRNA maturation RNase YbeY [Pseudomonadota bacterium]